MEELLDEIPPKKQLLQFRWGIALTWISLFAVGYLFLLMHWPFAGIVQLIGTGGFMAYSLSLFFLVNKRSLSLIICSILSFLLLARILWGIFVYDDYSLNATGEVVQGIALGILLILHSGIFLVIKKVRENQK